MFLTGYAMLLTAVIIVCVMALFVLGAVVCVHYRRRGKYFNTHAHTHTHSKLANICTCI